MILSSGKLPKEIQYQKCHLLSSYESKDEIIFLFPIQLWKREGFQSVEKISLNRIDQVESMSIVYNDEMDHSETLEFPLFTQNNWKFALNDYEHVAIHVEMNSVQRNICPFYISDAYKLEIILQKI